MSDHKYILAAGYPSPQEKFWQIIPKFKVIPSIYATVPLLVVSMDDYSKMVDAKLIEPIPEFLENEFIPKTGGLSAATESLSKRPGSHERGGEDE